MLMIPCFGEALAVNGNGRFLLARAQDAAHTLMEKYAGSVQTIYLDPPFGTGDVFTARLGRAGEKIRVPAYADNLSQEEYLSMMRQVLELCHGLLSPEGSLYLHIDQRMSAHLRLLLDAVFGAANFVNEIIWTYRSGGRSTRYFSRKHDNILLYRKSRHMYFSLRELGKPRGPRWRNHMKRGVDEQGKVYYSIRSGGREYVYHEDEPVYPGDVWEDIEHLHQRDPERTGYGTQKPEALLKRILLASSRPGDLVMDLFSGSGTTAATAARLGRRWVAVDASPVALAVLRKRLLFARQQADLFTPEGRAHIDYLMQPGPLAEPALHMERRGREVCVSPLQKGLMYLALGDVREGVFYPAAYDLEPAPGKSLCAPAEAAALQATDVYGKSGVWAL